MATTRRPPMVHFHAKPKQWQTSRASDQAIPSKSWNERGHHPTTAQDALSLAIISSPRTLPSKRQRAFGAPAKDDDLATSLGKLDT